MRREGFEIAVSRPQVIFKDINGEKHESHTNKLLIDIDEEQ